MPTKPKSNEAVDGELKLAVPEGATITVSGRTVKVKGPKGELSRTFSDARFDRFLEIASGGKEVLIKYAGDRRKIKSFAGTIRAHIRNMAEGVTKGYTYTLKVFYTHFPITAELKGTTVIVKNFLGEKSIRKSKILPGVKAEIKKDDIVLKGIDREAVGQSAANIETSCRLSGKDRRVFLDGIYITGWEAGEGKE